MILTGRIKEYDAKFKRIKLEYSTNNNTKIILDAKDKRYYDSLKLQGDYDSDNKGFWSPNYKSMFICKLDKNVFCYDMWKSRVTDFSTLIGQNVNIEVELLDFVNSSKEDERFGWFIKVLSIQGIASY